MPRPRNYARASSICATCSGAQENPPAGERVRRAARDAAIPLTRGLEADPQAPSAKADAAAPPRSKSRPEPRTEARSKSRPEPGPKTASPTGTVKRPVWAAIESGSHRHPKRAMQVMGVAMQTGRPKGDHTAANTPMAVIGTRRFGQCQWRHGKRSGQNQFVEQHERFLCKSENRKDWPTLNHVRPGMPSLLCRCRSKPERIDPKFHNTFHGSDLRVSPVTGARSRRRSRVDDSVSSHWLLLGRG